MISRSMVTRFLQICPGLESTEKTNITLTLHRFSDIFPRTELGRVLGDQDLIVIFLEYCETDQEMRNQAVQYGQEE